VESLSPMFLLLKTVFPNLFLLAYPKGEKENRRTAHVGL
jgi:hypothetical protein